MSREIFQLFLISYRSFCCGCCLLSIWFFVLTSFAPVKHYLCVWLLALQFVYFCLALVSMLCLSQQLAGLSRLLLPVNFSMSCTIMYVTVSSRQGMDELLRLGNCSLHIAPTIFNIIELFFAAENQNTSKTTHGNLLSTWDVFVPILVMLAYYYLCFTKGVYEIQFDVNLPSTIIVALLSGLLSALAMKQFPT